MYAYTIKTLSGKVALMPTKDYKFASLVFTFTCIVNQQLSKTSAA